MAQVTPEEIAEVLFDVARPLDDATILTTSVAVVVPTRHESGNVRELHRRLTRVMPATGWELVYVDDSDDDTTDVLRALAAEDARVRVLHRDGAERTGGLGGAVMWGVAHTTSDVVVVMDGDLQHPPETVPAMIAAFDDDVDLVVGSRHVEDGSSRGLSSAFRRLASRTCQYLAYAVVPRSRATTDPLSGFFAVRRRVVEPAALQPDGYKILLEVLGRGHWRTSRDVGFEFAARTSGASKSDLAEARRYLRHLRALHGRTRETARTREATEVLRGDPVHDRPLRVLLFTSEAPPVVSGIATCIANLRRTLTARGHRVDLVSRADFPRFERGEVRLSAFVFAWRRFRRTVAAYDVVNVHGPVPTMSEAFLLLSRTLDRRSRPTIVYTHHSDIAIPGLRPLCWVYNRFTQLVARLADVVLVSTEAYADKFTNLPAPVEVIPWGVDTTGKVRPRGSAARDGLRVLFVGQLRPYKGVHVLLDAVRDLPDVRVSIVGDGPERPALEAQAATSGLGNVAFRGRVSDEELWHAYSEHDVVVLPSLTSAEAFGLVLAEGMAAGCVPVASDLPGVREVAGPSGLLVKPGDAGAVRLALSSLAADAGLRASLAEASIQQAADLTVDANGARHEQVFFRALGERHPAAAGRAA